MDIKYDRVPLQALIHQNVILREEFEKFKKKKKYETALMAFFNLKILSSDYWRERYVEMLGTPEELDEETLQELFKIVQKVGWRGFKKNLIDFCSNMREVCQEYGHPTQPWVRVRDKLEDLPVGVVVPNVFPIKKRNRYVF